MRGSKGPPKRSWEPSSTRGGIVGSVQNCMSLGTLQAEKRPTSASVAWHCCEKAPSRDRNDAVLFFAARVVYSVMPWCRKRMFKRGRYSGKMN